MMNRNAAFEITRFGENAPRISCQKLRRPAAVARLAAGAALVPIVPAAGFMGFTRGSLFLARQNYFHAAVSGAAIRGRVRSEGLRIAVGMDAETAVREVCGSFSLQPVSHCLSAPLRQIHVSFAGPGIVRVSIQSDEECAGNGEIVLDLVHFALAFGSKGSLPGGKLDAPVAFRNDRSGIPAGAETGDVSFRAALREHGRRSENIGSVENFFHVGNLVGIFEQVGVLLSGN